MNDEAQAQQRRELEDLGYEVESLAYGIGWYFTLHEPNHWWANPHPSEEQAWQAAWQHDTLRRELTTERDLLAAENARKTTALRDIVAIQPTRMSMVLHKDDLIRALGTDIEHIHMIAENALRGDGHADE